MILFVKGADSAMKDKIKQSQQDAMISYTSEMAADGLRTLALAMRIMTRDEFDKWRLEFDAANTSLKKRSEKLEAVICSIEKNMEFVGITAVEDLLQSNVKQSIELLRAANIKVWMLTGDKLETAKCISLSTGLLNRNDHMWEVNGITNGEILRQRFVECLQSYQKHRVASSY